MFDKVTTTDKLMPLFRDGQIIMIGGFLKCGYPAQLVNELLSKELQNLTIISNDTATNDSYLYHLIQSGSVKKIHASYIGGNRATGEKYLQNSETVHLYPQGSLAEKIRCGGAGLGGVLTKVGLGTTVEKNKQIIILGKETFLVEESLRADIALIYARKADKFGNLQMKGTEINFNSLMAAAADTTIVLVEELLLDEVFMPEEITVPSIFVDFMICKGG